MSAPAPGDASAASASSAAAAPPPSAEAPAAAGSPLASPPGVAPSAAAFASGAPASPPGAQAAPGPAGAAPLAFGQASAEGAEAAPPPAPTGYPTVAPPPAAAMGYAAASPPSGAAGSGCSSVAAPPAAGAASAAGGYPSVAAPPAGGVNAAGGYPSVAAPPAGGVNAAGGNPSGASPHGSASTASAYPSASLSHAPAPSSGYASSTPAPPALSLPPNAPTRSRLESLLSEYLSRSELDKLEEHADLFAILKTTEKLERAYVRDAVSAAEYGPECAKLIAQFRTLWEAARGNVGGVHGFAAKHRLAIPYATKRLLGSGVPATVEYGDSHFGRGDAGGAGGGGGGGGGAGGEGGAEPPATGAAIAETVQYFITSMDSLKLNMTAIDQVYPILTSLQAAVAKVPGIPKHSSGRASIAKWVDKLHDMPAHYTLSDEESRQLLFEIDAAYSEFMRMLQT